MEYREIIKEKLDEVNLSELEGILDDSPPEIYEIIGDYSVDGIINSLISGTPVFDTGQIISGIADLFMYEIKNSLVLGVEIITVSILIGLLKSISSSFGEKAVSNLGMIVSTCFIIGLCLNNFMLTFDLCENTVDTMTRIMQVMLPVMIPLLIASGGIASGGMLSPVFSGVITAFTTIMSEIILPAVYISTVFYMINSLTDKDYVNRLAEFIRNASVFLCGLSVTLFSGLVAVQSFVSETADGLLAETTKYSASNFIPIVGGFAADSLDLALHCAKIVKNGIGLFGIIVFIAILILPIVRLLAIAVLYKLTAIITEPLGNSQVSGCLNQMGNSVITMTVVLFLSSFMFLIFMSIIIGIGG